MALNIKSQLFNSEGLLEIIVCEGLSHSIIIHPTIHGEPLLTMQPFYYLEQLESVAEIRFEDRRSELSDVQIEFLIDNYLFEYSKIDNRSKLCTKGTDFKYWLYDPSDMYAMYDQRNTRALVLDKGNDDSILSIETLEEDESVSFNDWCLIRNYSDAIFEKCLHDLCDLINKKVRIKVVPTEERDGYFGKARLLECNYGLVDYFQAEFIDSIGIREINPDMTSVPIKGGLYKTPLDSIPITRISLTKYYNPTLLSYYFSGLKEHNPLLSFVGFYNALEYYFEEAPLLLNNTAKIEREQFLCVIKLITTNEGIEKHIESTGEQVRNCLHQDIQTSSGIAIPGFNPTAKDENITELARWLYDIRCAIVHSKKTRKGKTTAAFEPYSTCVENIKNAVPIAKWLAILCIEKDYELGGVDVPYNVGP
jgi:hypothetical protein